MQFHLKKTCLCEILRAFPCALLQYHASRHLHQRPKRSPTSSGAPVWFSAEQNTIMVSREIRHVDLSHTSHNEISSHSLLSKLAEGEGEKIRNWRRGDPLHHTFLYLDEWIVPLSLSFFSIKRLPFGMLPSFMIIKTFACQRRRLKKGGVARLI